MSLSEVRIQQIYNVAIIILVSLIILNCYTFLISDRILISNIHSISIISCIICLFIAYIFAYYIE